MLAEFCENIITEIVFALAQISQHGNENVLFIADCGYKFFSIMDSLVCFMHYSPYILVCIYAGNIGYSY